MWWRAAVLHDGPPVLHATPHSHSQRSPQPTHSHTTHASHGCWNGFTSRIAPSAPPTPARANDRPPSVTTSDCRGVDSETTSLVPSSSEPSTSTQKVLWPSDATVVPEARHGAIIGTAGPPNSPKGLGGSSLGVDNAGIFRGG